MLQKAFRRNTEENRLVRLLLVFALVFAAAHVALHDLGLNGDSLGAQDDCQVCRLTLVPVASLAPPSLFIPLQLTAYLLPVKDTEYQLPHLFHAQWARAPPLF